MIISLNAGACIIEHAFSTWVGVLETYLPALPSSLRGAVGMATALASAAAYSVTATGAHPTTYRLFA